MVNTIFFFNRSMKCYWKKVKLRFGIAYDLIAKILRIHLVNLRLYLCAVLTYGDPPIVPMVLRPVGRLLFRF